MKTKPGGAGSSNPGASGSAVGSSSSGSSSARSHSKRSSGSRERDKLKLAISAESGCSSQCDTPPHNEKDLSAGKVAGISPESVLCAAEQIGIGVGAGIEISQEAASALAEDASFKLRQIIHCVWVRSQVSRRSGVTADDVTGALRLMDTEPVLGADAPRWHSLRPAADCCYEPESLVYVREAALQAIRYTPAATPALAARWVNAGTHTDVHPALRAYCMQVSRVLLKGSTKAKALVLSDLATNTRVGPIVPNLLNLAVLVLNNENLNTLHVGEKEPLKRAILDMLEALCANPCGRDTDVLRQLQRLYPSLVTDILNSGPLADKMIQVMTKIANTWPAFLHIGEKTLYTYLVSGGACEPSRVCGAAVRCLAALGRGALVACLEPHLDYVDRAAHAPAPLADVYRIPLPGALLDAASVLLRPNADTLLEDHVTIDYTLYEILGDSVLPLRLQPLTDCPPEKAKEDTETHQDEDLLVLGAALRPARGSVRALAPRPPALHASLAPLHRTAFESTFRPPRITISVRGARIRPVTSRFKYSVYENSYRSSTRTKIVVVCGKLARFTYKLPYKSSFPAFAGYVL